jgi:hypothetical protein
MNRGFRFCLIGLYFEFIPVTFAVRCQRARPRRFDHNQSDRIDERLVDLAQILRNLWSTRRRLVTRANRNKIDNHS